MTGILIDWDGTGTGTIVVARTHLEVDGARIRLTTPTAHRITGPTIIDLDPTDPGEAWRVRIYPQSGLAFSWWVTVPATDDVVPLAELPRVDPTTLQAEPPDQKAWAAELADIRAALAALPATSAPAVSHIAVTAEGRLVHRVGGTTTLTTTTSGRLAAVRA